MTTGLRGYELGPIVQVRWKPEQDAEVIARRGRGESFASIAQAVGHTPQAVKTRAYRVLKLSGLMPKPRTIYTPALDAEIRRRWELGDSASLIGRAIGLGKNAIIGLAHRLGLKPRANPILTSRLKEIRAAAQRAKAAQKGKCSPILNSTKGCRFIEGDPIVLVRSGRDPFCGMPTEIGRSYCPDHHRRCFTPRVPALRRVA